MNIRILGTQILESLGFKYEKEFVNFIQHRTGHGMIFWEKDHRWVFSVSDFGALQGPKNNIQRFYCCCKLDSGEDEMGFIGHYEIAYNRTLNWNCKLLSMYEIDVDVAKHMILAANDAAKG